jgi:hypothetical protein
MSSRSRTEYVGDTYALRIVLQYCQAQRRPCWVVHNRMSCELLGMSPSGAACHIRIANGDDSWVPSQEVGIRVQTGA